MNKKVIWALLAFCAASFIGQLIIYPRLPEQVPVHWNANNEIDGWAGKGSALLMGLLPLLMLLLFIAVPKIDPKKENFVKHAGVYQMFAEMMTVFMGGVSWMALSAVEERWLPRAFAFSTLTTMSPSLADSPTSMPS